MPLSRSLQVRARQPWQEKDEQTVFLMGTPLVIYFDNFYTLEIFTAFSYLPISQITGSPCVCDKEREAPSGRKRMKGLGKVNLRTTWSSPRSCHTQLWLIHTKALCALTPKCQLLLEMGNLLSWLMVAVSI